MSAGVLGASRLLGSLARYGLSGRGFHGALRVARTISDLGGGGVIAEEALLEACTYRAA